MTVRATEPNGHRWLIRRGVVRGPDGRGWRWRWRGPDPSWLEALRIAELAELADVPVVGVIALVIVAPVVIAVAVVFLPFVALAFVEALVLGVLVTVLVAAATLFGRPVVVRATRVGQPEDEEQEMIVWAVKGWAASRRTRDAVADALRTGFEPTKVVPIEATLIADHRRAVPM